MMLPDPGTPRFGYHPQSCNKLAGVTGTLKRCGAGQRDRNLPVPPHRTSSAQRPGQALGPGLRTHTALICSAHPWSVKKPAAVHSESGSARVLPGLFGHSR